ncbi:hypothetical protein DFA_09833 [Cavenderia fasciculata]|uniref:Uncharacterized protein n=1 Tax=Cavenderia fasciculata TaxID=261658 RepID=F4QAV4_CACFS|nr:uncharacterized protein DFA_09833 [Cavenderia fasciculata]EGG15013.1 hypothetical protein DFA_09833 [Cavenderia fasciculata]|eukprot:XP_004351733.1 hypothetical protein DFA_09833 [Cavenderia fasciculata]
MGAPPLIVNAVMSMLADSSVRVRVGDSLSEPFHTASFRNQTEKATASCPPQLGKATPVCRRHVYICQKHPRI